MEVSLPVAVWFGSGSRCTGILECRLLHALCAGEEPGTEKQPVGYPYRSRRLYGGDRRFPAFGQYQRGFRETDGTFGRPENEFVYHLFLRGKYAGSRYIIACLRRVQTYQPGTVHPAEQATEQRCRESGGEPGGFRGDGCLLCIYL